MSQDTRGFNPRAAHADDFEKDAAQTAKAAIPVNTDSKIAHWDESARALLAAIIIWARPHPEKD